MGVIGASCLNYDTGIEFMTKLMEILKEKRADNTLVFFGGIIVPDYVPSLKEVSVA